MTIRHHLWRLLRTFGIRRRHREITPPDTTFFPSIRTGLCPSIFETFPILEFSHLKTISENQENLASECAVCLAEFEDHELCCLIPVCRHFFHLSCIDRWLFENTTCPFCRAKLTPNTRTSHTTRVRRININSPNFPGPQVRTATDDLILQPARVRRHNSGRIRSHMIYTNSNHTELQNHGLIETSSEENNSTGPEQSTLGTPPEVLWKKFWKQKAPFRLKVKVCRLLTGAIKLNCHSKCVLCNSGLETPEHLIFQCRIVKTIWDELWGIDTRDLIKWEWSMANWVEAVLYPKRIMGMDMVDDDDGELFLFMCCCVDKVLFERDGILEKKMGRGEDEFDLKERLRCDIVTSFVQLKRAYCVGSERSV